MEGDKMINDTINNMTEERKRKSLLANAMDDDERSTLINGLILIGVISAVLMSWLMYQKPKRILGKLNNMRSYENLFIFIAVVYLRTIVALISRFDSVKQIATIWFIRCDILAFLETFFAVFEVEALTHVCIERYVVAKYITKGWKIVVGHYLLYSYLCLLFVALYSVPPLYGLGRYGCDFGCVSCTYDMILPDTWQQYLIPIVFFLRSFKPTAYFMAIMLIWAGKLESNFDAVMKKKADLHFTKCVTTLTFVNLACWAPIALVRACVVLSQMLCDEIYIPSACHIRCAMWIDEVTPIFTTITIFLYRRYPSIPVPASCRHHCGKHDIIANVGDNNELTTKGD